MKTLIILITFLISINSYSQWISQTSGTAVQLNDIWMLSASEVIAVGSPGTIIRTTNGGTNWAPVTSGTTAELVSIYFANSVTGWIRGNGVLLKTVNGGNVWNIVNNHSGYGKLFFINNQTGWCTSYGGYIRKTTNGGTNWNDVDLPIISLSSEVCFLNSNTGFAIGYVPAHDSSYIYKSTNAGANWQVLHGFNYMFNSFDVNDENNIYLSGPGGDFMKTNNGGVTWDYSVIDFNLTIKDITFTNNTTGYVCGSDGNVFATFNGGANWQSQTPGTGSSLIKVSFLGASNEVGFSTGMNGVILKTTNGGISGIQSTGNEVPAGFSLSQNYPNPFNPTTNIRIQLPKEGFAKLTVFDVTGKEAAVLVNENLRAGEYKVDFNASAMPSGVYFYRLTIEGFTDVKKMILVK